MYKKYFIIAILITIFLFYLFYIIGTTKITIHFKDLEPLKEHLPVYYNGFKLGHTTGIYPSKDYKSTMVDIRIVLKKLKLPANTTAVLRRKEKKDYIELKYPDAPYFMLGFSLGSFLLREYISRHPKEIKGAIIAGTGYQPAFVLDIMMFIVSTQITKNDFDNTTDLVRKLSFDTYNDKFKPCRTRFDWLCSDEAQLDEYMNDDACRRDISSGLFYQLLSSMKRTGQQHACVGWNKEMPVLLMSGRDDPVGNMGKGVVQILHNMEKRGFRDVKICLYENARHDIFHEYANGTADKVTEEIARWIGEKL